MQLRSQTELFALAERAREKDDIARGAVGASGHGFALANQIESRRFSAGGSKLINLANHLHDAWAAGCVLTLTAGAAELGDHSEELFSLTLFCVAPDGAQDVLKFYNGPSGLALSTGEQLDHGGWHNLGLPESELRVRYDRLQIAARSLAAAWEAALHKVPPTPFAITADSDFGKSELRWPKRGQGQSSPGTWSPSFPSADASAARTALAAARGVEADEGAAACRALEEIEARRGALTEEARKSIEHEYSAVAERLWLPALDHLEREIRAASGFDLPREIDLLATILPSPQIRSIVVPRERRAALYDLVRQVRARRWATHPWRF